MCYAVPLLTALSLIPGGTPEATAFPCAPQGFATAVLGPPIAKSSPVEVPSCKAWPGVEMDPCKPPPDDQGPPVRLQAEYLLWWVKGAALPPVATTSAPQDLGVLGAPSTSILAGGGRGNTGPLSGMRIS